MTLYLIELFTNLYGKHELLHMSATRIGLYEPSKTGKLMLGVRQEEAPSLGKSIFALNIPARKIEGWHCHYCRSSGHVPWRVLKADYLHPSFRPGIRPAILAEAAKVEPGPVAGWERGEHL